MRRREFIKLLTGAAVAVPRAAIAQAPPKVFHLGTLAPGAPLDEKNPLTAILLKGTGTPWLYARQKSNVRGSGRGWRGR
jgi:hypothetical protein